MTAQKVEFQDLDKIARMIEAKVAAVSADAHTTISIVAGGQRGQALNTLIARVQAGVDRNPFYLSKDEREALKFILRGMTSEDAGTRRAAVDKAGREMLDAVLRHVLQQQNKSGKPFKALSERYAAYKRRKFGFVVPILKATGDLLGGLRVLVDRRRR